MCSHHGSRYSKHGSQRKPDTSNNADNVQFPAIDPSMPMSLTVTVPLNSCVKCSLKCDLSWAIAITILLNCERPVSRIIASWLLPSMVAILILMMVSKFGASFISCVRSPLRISTSTLKASLMATDRFLPRVLLLPNASLWEPSSSIDLP